jgi:cholesterol transport system auxiliary component
MKSLNRKSCKVAATIVSAVWVMLLSSCSLLQPVKPAAMTTYALEVQFDTVTNEQGTRTLLVNTPSADPGFNSARMIYIKNPHEIAYFVQNQWVGSPSRMLAPLLVRALEHSANFRAVVQSRSDISADLRLDTEIVRLQQEFFSRPSQVHLTVRAQLLDMQANVVLATREFDIVEDAPSEDPHGGVIATNLAVKKLLLQISEFCSVKSEQVTSKNHAQK